MTRCVSSGATLQSRMRNAMNDRVAVLLGEIAVELGMITRSQLDAVLDEQGRVRKTPIGALLVIRGILSHDELTELLREQKRRLKEPAGYGQLRREDTLFGRVAQKMRLADAEEVSECLRMQATLAARGVVVRLGELLVRRGYMNAWEVAQAMAGMGHAMWYCLACDRAYGEKDLPADPARCPSGHALTEVR